MDLEQECLLKLGGNLLHVDEQKEEKLYQLKF